MSTTAVDRGPAPSPFDSGAWVFVTDDPRSGKRNTTPCAAVPRRCVAAGASRDSQALGRGTKQEACPARTPPYRPAHPDVRPRV